MGANTKDILESLDFIKENMATKRELSEFRSETEI